MSVDYSVVIPILNEEESLPELIRSIEKTFSNLKKSYEVIFIDDGSTDKTLQLLKEFSSQKKYIRIYSFRRNMTKSIALTYGFQKAIGKYVLTMDADLQDDPSNLEKLSKKMEDEKLDMVSGWRKSRQDSGFKIITSKFFNKTVSLLFNINVHDLNCGLKLYKNEVVKELDLYGGIHRFIPVLVHEMGFRTGEEQIVHHVRKYGYSKYKSTKMLTDLPDIFTLFFLAKYNNRPLHFFGRIGTLLFGFGLLILLYLAIIWFSGNPIGTRPLLLFGILLTISGIQVTLTGFLADLIVFSKRSNILETPLKYESQ